MSVWKKGYWGLVQGENYFGHLFLLIIRLFWGIQLIIAGFGKWMHIQGVIDYFTSLNIPLPALTAYGVGTIEFLGGISLVFGLFSRVFSLLLTIVFIGAYATAHKESLGTLLSKPSDFTSEAPFLFLFTSLIVLSFGPGIFSFDYWIEKRNYGKPL